MSLRIPVCSVSQVERAAATGRYHEVLAVMPENECAEEGWLRWPRISLPRTVVAVSDLGCAAPLSDAQAHSIAKAKQGVIAPDRTHAQSILAFGRRVMTLAAETGDYGVIIHCHAGISRSAAAALLIMAQADGPGQEQRSIERLLKIAPKAMPNRMIIRHGDALLGRRGGLVLAVMEMARKAESDTSPCF